MTDTSSSRHRLRHDYAELGSAFPGALGGHGVTAQSVGRPEILAEANVGAPVVQRAARKPNKSNRAARKS